MQIAETPLLRAEARKRLAHIVPSFRAQLVPRGITNGQGNFLLTFPHTANGSAGGLKIRSSVTLINNAGVAAAGTIFLRKSDGTDLIVTTDQGTGSSFQFNLGPGEVFRIETDGSGDLETGWVEVVSDIPVSGSGGFDTFDSNDRILSTVGVADSPRGQSFLVFLDRTDGKNTGFAVANTSSKNDADVTLTLKRLDGTVVATTSILLGPGRQLPRFVPEAFPELDLDGFVGILKLESATEISVTSLRTRGTLLTSLPTAPFVEVAEPDEDDVPPLVFARIADGIFGTLDFETTLVFMNNTALDADVAITIFDTNGQPLELGFGEKSGSSFSVTVPAGCAVQLVSDGTTNPGAVGWVTAQSNVPVTGGAAFTLKDRQSGRVLSDVGIPSSVVTDNMSLFVRVDESIDTGIGITEPTGFPTEVRFRLYGQSVADPAASLLRRGPTINRSPDFLEQRILTFNGLEHKGLFVSELFPDVPEVAERRLSGRLEVQAVFDGIGPILKVPMGGITLTARGALLTSQPVADHKTFFSPHFYFVPATEIAGSSPGFCLAYNQRSGELPIAAAEFTIGDVSLDLSGLETDEVGTYVLNASGFLIMGTLFIAPREDGSVDFFTLVNLAGDGESNLFTGQITNLAGGGIRIKTETDPNVYLSDQSSLSLGAYLTNICFDSGILQMPAEAGSIEITERFESAPPNLFSETLAVPLQTGERLIAERTSTYLVESPVAGAPQINAVSPSEAIGGGELEVSGSGFSSSGANTVTLSNGSSMELTVLEANSTRLLTRVPQGVQSSMLMVETDGQNSNPYQVRVAFAPDAAVIPASRQAGDHTPLKIEIRQQRGSISLLDFSLTNSLGEWNLSGLSADQKVGELEVVFPELSSLSEPTVLDLIVESMSGEVAVINAIDPSEDEPETQFVIRIERASDRLTATSPEIDGPTSVLSSLLMKVDFTEPVFSMPDGVGAVVTFDFEVLSQPRRALNRISSLSATASANVMTQ